MKETIFLTIFYIIATLTMLYILHKEQLLNKKNKDFLDDENSKK